MDCAVSVGGVGELTPGRADRGCEVGEAPSGCADFSARMGETWPGRKAGGFRLGERMLRRDGCGFHRAELPPGENGRVREVAELREVWHGFKYE